MPAGQNWFTEFMEKGGYQRDPEGMCLGMAQASKQFLLVGKVNYFNHLIDHLHKTAQVTQEVEAADYADDEEAQAAFNIKMDELQKSAETLGIKDLRMEIQALLDAVGFYYNPQNYPHLLGEHPSRGQFHSELDSLLTSSVVTAAGGIFNGYERVLMSSQKIDKNTNVPVNTLLVEVDEALGVASKVFWMKDAKRFEVELSSEYGKDLYPKLLKPNQDDELANEIKQKIAMIDSVAENQRPVGFSSFRGDYNDEELAAYFSTFEENAKAALISQPVVLLLSSNDHTMTVAYLPSNEENEGGWYLVDPNNLPAVRIEREDLAPAIFEAFFIPDEEESFLMETSVFSLSGQESLLESVIRPWQENNAPVHDVSERMVFSALGGSIAEVTALIEQGADVNHADVSGRTALTYSIYNNHLSMAKKLIELGAEVRDEDIALSTKHRRDDITKVLKFAKNKPDPTFFANSRANKEDILKSPKNR